MAFRRRQQSTDGSGSPGPSPTPLFSPASPQVVAAAEASLGFALPPLLAKLYREVANGGFGPSYGVLGLRGGQVDAEGRSLDELYALWRDGGGWPTPLLPVVDWGCAIWSCVDARRPEGGIVTMDQGAFTATNFTLQS